MEETEEYTENSPLRYWYYGEDDTDAWYHEALDGNDWQTLVEVWEEVQPDMDPLEVWGRDYGGREQEHLFDLGVSTYGGGFARDLLTLYQSADPDNREKIRDTWPTFWIKYVGMGAHKEEEQQEGSE